MTRPSLSPSRWTPPKAPARARQKRSAADVRLEIVWLPGSGPEDIWIDPDGTLLTGLADGRVLCLSADRRRMDEVVDTGGRPLGIERFPDGDILVCDAERGLLRIHDGVIEVLVDEVLGERLIFCSNALIGEDGTIWFTQSSARYNLHDYRADLMEHTQTGRLHRRDPDGTVHLVRDGLSFANGIAFTPDRSALVVAQTTEYSLDKLWLTGPRAGEWDVLADNLPGFPDNISLGTDGLIWVSLASPRDPVLDLLLPKHPALRKAAFRLPERLQPQPKKTAWVQAFDPASGDLVHDLQTPNEQFYFVTAVVEHHGVLWLGSLTAPALGRIELSTAG